MQTTVHWVLYAGEQGSFGNLEGGWMRVWAGVSLFFCVGVAIGLAVAKALVEQPGFDISFAGALGIGAMVGGYGAWLVFALSFRVVCWISARLRRVEPGAAADGGL